MKLSNSNIKKLPIFSQEKHFLIFCELIPPTHKKKKKKKKKIQETKISGNGNPKKLLMFQEVTLQARKMKIHRN